MAEPGAEEGAIKISVNLVNGKTVLESVQVNSQDTVDSVLQQVAAALPEALRRSVVKMVSPSGVVLDRSAAVGAAGLADGDSLTAVLTQACSFHGGLQVRHSDNCGRIEISEDGRAIRKVGCTEEHGEASIRTAVPIPSGPFFVTFAVTEKLGGHMQIGLTTVVCFEQHGADHSKHRLSGVCSWGIDTGGSDYHQFGSTLGGAGMKARVARAVQLSHVHKGGAGDPITLAMKDAALWLSVGNQVVGKIAVDLPQDQDLFVFVVIEPQVAALELHETPTEVMDALQAAMAEDAAAAPAAAHEAEAGGLSHATQLVRVPQALVQHD